MATLGRLGRLAVVLAVMAGTAVLTAGCTSAGYLGQAVSGHLELLARARPVPHWLADPDTPPALRERLALSQQMREFAVRELALPDNRSYRAYAELDRPAAVWNVVAAPELSLQLKRWCFPVAGCVGYRGYFEREAAEALAAELRAQGWEVHVYGVPAYSTLGRTDWLGGDPLLSTFLHWPEGELARLMFHELAHQRVYLADDTTFNESYATAVETLGLRRWLQRHATPAVREAHARLQSRREDFRALVARHRERLQALYDSPAPEADKRQAKARLTDELREQARVLKATRWQGHAGFDAWFASVNNASLGIQAAYQQWMPAFERLFEQQGGDFARFHEAARRLAALPREQRQAALAALSPAQGETVTARRGAPRSSTAVSSEESHRGGDQDSP